MDICIQADLILLFFILLHLADTTFFFFCKLKVCDNLAFSKSISTISPTHLLTML